MPLPRLGCGGPTRDMTPSGLVEDSATKVKPHAIVTVEKESKQNQDQATAPCLAEVVINADEDNSTQSKTFASLLTKIATKKPSTEDIKPDRLSTSQGTQSPFDRESCICPSTLGGVSRGIMPDTVAQGCKDSGEHDAELQGEVVQSPPPPASVYKHPATSELDARPGVAAKMPSSEQDCNGAAGAKASDVSPLGTHVPPPLFMPCPFHA